MDPIAAKGVFYGVMLFVFVCLMIAANLVANLALYWIKKSFTRK